ncbi:MAG: hypothetical protein ACJ76H_08490 [Bacteriovoracaceae bacterium]
MRILHFLFLSIFTFHFNVVHATKLLVPISPEIVQALVDNYNGLSQEQKWSSIRALLEKNDPKFLAIHEKMLKDVKWPELQYGKEGIKFAHDNGTMTISIDDDKNAVINGRKVHIEKGSYGKSFNEIVTVVETPKTSLFNFIIDDAHAIAPLVAAIIALMAIAVWAFILHPAINVVKAATLRAQCYEVQDELGASNVKTLSQSDAEVIRAKANEIIAKSENDLAGANCKENAAACQGMKEALSCYQRVLAQVNEFHPAINDSDRKQESFLERWTPSFMRSKPSGSSHQ